MLFLLIAAVLEVGGDALTAYGYLVNRPGWEFGRSLGLYVVLFFIVTQIISWVVFHRPPGRGVLAGGPLIAVGGVIVYAVK